MSSLKACPTQLSSPTGGSPEPSVDVSGGLVVSLGGGGGERGPTVVTLVGDLVGEGLGPVEGSRMVWRGAGVIRAGLFPKVVGDTLRPVAKGSGATLRGGILDAGDVRVGNGERMPIGGSALGKNPI